MSIKRTIFDTFIKTVYHASIRLSQKSDSLIDFSKLSNRDLCLFTIAFNKPFLIENQIRLIKKNIKDRDFVHIVADNSSNKDIRGEIRSICQREGVPYISLPFNLMQSIYSNGSYAHGLAMTWIYHNLANRLKPQYFGFLDHDIFPISSYSFAEQMANNAFYGRVVNRTSIYTPPPTKSDLWYLWAGFCCFRRSFLDDKSVMFAPCMIDGIYLDTGGSLYKSIFKHYKISELPFNVDVENKKIGTGDQYHADFVQYIDKSWIHTINGSGWAKVRSKEEQIKALLQNF